MKPTSKTYLNPVSGRRKVVVKRGQVAVFLLVGVILLLTIGLFWMYKHHFRLPERQIDPLFLPIQQYVESCLSASAEEALIIMGIQGGYITLPDTILADPSGYIINDPDGLAKTPLWEHREQSRVPTIEAMREELGNYVKENVRTCLADFISLRQQFSVEPKDEPKIQVGFTPTNVEIDLEYELDIRELSTKKITTIDHFITSIPVPLQQLYNTAFEAFQVERDSLFLENVTMDLFTANPAIPFTDLRFTCDIDTWEVDTVKEEMIATLRANIPRIRVKGTPHAPFQQPLEDYEKATSYTFDDIMEGKYPANPPEDLYEYTHLYWEVFSGDRPYALKLLYEPRWGFDMNAYPSKGGRLYTRPVPMSKEYLRFFCMSLYHFTYDVRYPVVAQVKDPDALYGRGYTFQFALPVTIKQNQGIREPLTVSSFQGTSFDPEFCQSIGDKKVIIEARGLQDGYYDLPVINTNISMRCVLFECPLGLTQSTSSGPRLITYLPEGCSNPTFVAEKKGFLAGEAQDEDGDGFIPISMTALKSFTLQPVIYTYEKTSNRFISSGFPGEEMNIAVLFASPSYSTTSTYPGNAVELALTEEAYEVNVILYKEDKIIGGWHGIFVTGAAENKNTLVLPVIEYRPRPTNDDQRSEMMQYIFSDLYQEVTPIELK